jgi:hypothetical protein
VVHLISVALALDVWSACEAVACCSSSFSCCFNWISRLLPSFVWKESGFMFLKVLDRFGVVGSGIIWFVGLCRLTESGAGFATPVLRIG